MNSIAELESLWKQHPAGPDLAAFLKQRTLSLLDRLALLRRDQQLRWASPTPWLAEHYLQQLTPHPEGIDWTLELAAGEWLSRPDAQALTAEQFEARFPQLSGLPAHLVRGPDESEASSRIDDVCSQYESIYRSGNAQPQLEYALANLAVEHRGEGLQQLVEVELEFRSKLLPKVTAEELLRKFSLYAALPATLIHPARPGAAPTPAKPAIFSTSMPTKIDRYTVIRPLGQGSFGVVYLAENPDTAQQVAIKVPTQEAIEQGNVLEAYRKEARIAATLEHPRILRVLYCGQSAEFPFYIVTPYIEGCTLADRMRREKISCREAAKLIAAVASALAHAYKHKVVAHRDIKPANILLDKSNRPYLADFGLALRDRPRSSDNPGTPAYMSPEQAGNRGHLVDERSDIFSLGIVFYELLTGTRPFSGRDTSQLRANILSGTVRPPRDLDDRIPEELERICLKMLALRRQDRYQNAKLLKTDLLDFLKQVAPSSSTSVTQSGTAAADSLETSQGNALDTGPAPAGTADEFRPVTLPGLRAFEADDADYFLQLLPGSRERQNLPEIVSWWKSRLEERHDKRTFRVGGMMGPSGCGKSSLIRAGILPRLDPSVAYICISATPDHTETELLTAIHELSDLTLPKLSLPETLERIRCGEGLPADRKLVLVLDQFEQWLQKHRGQANGPLCMALRQCDGGRVQAVVLVRDDFYSPLTHFLELLDVRFEKYRNIRDVDLFDPDHARRVLRLFGVAYGRLPRQESEQTPTQEAFLDRAIEELTEEGKVICVRLALFARMFKSRDWSPEILAGIGGAAGVGRAFLEETFTSKRARPEYSCHRQAATEVLKRLIQRDSAQPEDKSEIKGLPHAASELQQVAGYADRPADFADLLNILDGDLRLITPVAAATSSVDSPIATPEASLYQLTHDYLVPSIREWLRMHQTAEERILEDRTYRWSADRESRQLPSLGEWLRIRLRTDRKRWTGLQRDLMRVAGRVHALRTSIVVAGLALVLLTLQSVRATSELNGMAGRVQNANPAGLTELLAEADRQGSALDERLRPIIQQADKPDADAATKLAAVPARLAVVIRDESQLPPLQEAMLTGELTYVAPIRTRLRRYAAKLRPQWFELLRNPAESAARRFRAALGLVGLDGDQAVTEWTDADIRFIATELSTSVAEYQPQLRELLRPISGQLVPVLDELFDAETSTADQQISIAMALADFAQDDTELLARLLTRATQRQTEILYPLVAETKTGPVRDGLLALTREQPDENLGQLARVRLGRRRANAAITLLRQGERDAYFDALRITDDPESLSQFVHRCRSWGVTPQELLESFDRCAELRKTATGAAKRLESRVLYGLLIALGNYPLDQLPEASREAVFAKLLALYESDPSAAVHSASGWLLRTLGREAEVARLDEVEVPYDESGERDWFRLRVGVAAKSNVPLGSLGLFGPLQYHSLTFVVFPAEEYRLGSPDFEGGEVDRQIDETPRVVQLTRPFAMCDREVTWGLYDSVMGDAMHKARREQFGWPLPNADPAFGATWFEWIEFCRALTSEYRGDDDRWQCYRDPAQLEKDGNGNPRAGRLLVERVGFRMPTESEWEVGARAGQRTAYTFGSEVNLLSTHGWFMDNSTGKRPQVSAAKPPGLGGLHDVQGNLFEWVHDRYGEIDGGSVIVDPQGPLSDGQLRVLRGGSWNGDAAFCRTAYRIFDVPAVRNTYYGFRLALSPSVNKPPEADEKEQQTQESN